MHRLNKCGAMPSISVRTYLPGALATQIADEMPPSPSSLNPRIQAGVSALIMKALAKDPELRYQSVRELVEDLEKCKENGGKKSATEVKKTAVKAAAPVAPSVRAAAANKFIASVPKAPES